MTRKIISILLALTLSLGITGALAVEYPTGTITLICPWGAGGSTDITARAVASVAEEAFGVPVVVVNREGGASTIGTQEVALNTDGDGYTILVATINALAVLPHTLGLEYSPADFKSVGQISVRDIGIICTADKPWDDINEFLEDAKEHPGEYLVAVPQGGLQHIVFQTLCDMTGASFTVYPVSGDTENLTAVLGGVADIGIPGSYDVAGGQIEAGEVKLLGFFSDRRVEAYPDVPTLMDLGYDISVYPWTVMLVPADTDAELLAKMQEVWAGVLQDEGLAGMLEKNKQIPQYLDGDATMASIQAQYDSFGVTIEAMGLAAE